MRRILSPAVAVFAAIAAGCGSEETGPPQPQPVSGQILYDGKPAVGVRVTLFPVDAPMVPRIPQNPHAVTGPDGRFRITTFTEGDGAAEGGYQVILNWPAEKKNEGEEPEETDRLLGWYDALHSTMNVRVKAGANELSVIRIPAINRPPEASQGVPGRN